MAQDILITPGSGEPQILFRGSGTNDTPIELNVLSSYQSANGSGSALLFEGTEGQLFAITDNLSSGVIFSVAGAAGLPFIEADASGDVRLIEYGRYVGVGTGTPAYQLDVFGTGRFSEGILFADGNVQTGAYTGDGGGGGSTPTGTASGVAFFGGDNNLTESTNLVFDSGNGRLGIGVANPLYDLHLGTNKDLFFQGGSNDWLFSVSNENLQIYLDPDSTNRNYLDFDRDGQLFVGRGGNVDLWVNGANTNDQLIRTDASSGLVWFPSDRYGFGFGGIFDLYTAPDAQVDIRSSLSSREVLTVRGAASQSANLQEWQDSAGTVLAEVDNAGNISGNNISFGNGTTQTTAFEVGGAAGQFQYNDGGTGLAGSDGFTYGGQTTGNILEVQTTGGDTLFYIDNNGNISGLAVATFGSGSLLLGTGVVFEVQNTGGTTLFAVEDTSETTVVVNSQVGQTSYPFEVRDEFGITAAYVDVSGNISGNNISFGDGTTQTTAAGPASVISDSNTGITMVCATHANSYLRTTSNSGVTITFPSGLGCDANSEFTFEQAGSGQITVTGDAGVTINTSSTTKTYTQFSVISMKQVATDTYTLFGDTASF